MHNDYQRHLPYLWAVPDFEKEKSHLYEHCQRTSGGDTGMITENPGFRESDSCGGRRMGDVTTIWALEVLEIYRNGNNKTRLVEVWPAFVRGVKWSIAMSVAQGLPAHLVCTYDILAMEQYNMTTFNGVLHLAMMQAAVRLAADPAINDAATGALAKAAFDAGVTAMTTTMWNSTYGYFRAYTGGDAIMSDCLYGQQVALAHGLGWLLPKDMIKSHLQAEAQYNYNAFGLTTVTGRHKPPPAGAAEAEAADEDEGEALLASFSVGADATAQRKAAKAADKRRVMQALRGRGDGQDDAVWMGAAPTWSCLALALGADGPAGTNVTAALEPTRRELENYRNRLRMMWDLTGLSTTDDWGSDDANGQPFCTVRSCAPATFSSAAAERARPHRFPRFLSTPPPAESLRVHAHGFLSALLDERPAAGPAARHAVLRAARRVPALAALRRHGPRGHLLVRRHGQVHARARVRRARAARRRAQRQRARVRGRRLARGRAERQLVRPWQQQM